MELILEYLKSEDITQTEFARRCGVTPGRISQILKGEDPSLALLRKMKEVTQGMVTADGFTADA